uniref:Integrin, alpha V n=1 Tax=Astyanax mexicanus TaxID=7994 RepID=A0A3B1IUT6_ASTMX
MENHLFWISLTLTLYLQPGTSFNLDIENPYVFSGPQGSYFGFSVDFFFKPSDKQSNVLIGAPKANSSSSSSSVTERGVVYSCPWGQVGDCKQLLFDNTDDRQENGVQMEFKSNQWFGATVRSDGEHILACAPLYQWSTYSFKEREPVGTCYLKKGSTVVEYSPCRSERSITPEGQGFCQAGFSADIIKVRPPSSYTLGRLTSRNGLISDDISEVINRNNQKFVTPYSNQMATKSASAQYDDSYLGKCVCVCVCDYATGVPRGEKALGYVNIFNGKNMESMLNFTGQQVSKPHFYSLITVCFPGMDLLVGAPLFMERGSDGKLREVGQVYVYLGKDGFAFLPPIKLTGSEIYARFGSAITSLGDLDMDGFNDVAIAAPYGGSSRQGLIYIHNGRPSGPDTQPSQVLEGRWASASMPPSFGYSMNGATDIDENGYPGEIHSRIRVLIGANRLISSIICAALMLYCKCSLSISVCVCVCVCSYSFTVKYCLKASGKGAPPSLKFQVDLTLDRLKQKGAIKRVLFLHTRLPQYTKFTTVSNGQGPSCEEQQAYLIDDSEFRDKITPISVFMEYSLDYQSAADKSGLKPILDQSTPANLTKQAHILLDCGEDNICKPDLKLSVVSDQKQIYIGDDNPLTLEVTAMNDGEGAYEAELHVIMPPQADFIGVVRNSDTLSRLSCAYKKENQTRVVCDLGNPMKGGTKIMAGLRFSVHQLSEQDTSVKFELQIQSSNQYNNTSNLVPIVTKLAVLANVEIRGVSAPEQIFLPIANWQPKEKPVLEDDIGPLVQHIYELRNKGPSTFTKAMLDVEWPYRYNNGSLLYITKYEVDGAMNCSTDMEINPLNVSNPMYWDKNTSISSGDRAEGARSHVHRRDLRDQQAEGEMLTLDCDKAQCLKIKCQVGRLERGQSAILFVYSRLAVATFLQTQSQNRSYIVKSLASFSVIEMPYKNLDFELPTNKTSASLNVVWVLDGPTPAPVWVVIVAVLSGLLLLALLIFIMHKLGFFNRVRPPQEDGTEKEQLQPQENGDRNTEA